MITHPKWNRPPKRSQMEARQVDIWRAFVPEKLDTMLTGSLSVEEKHRATRFLRPKDGIRYYFSHGMLRTVLAYYLSVNPQRIVLKTNPYGKPSLWQESAESDICFNMAHSEDMVVLAVASRAEVGVDVEFVRELEDARQIVSQNFSPEEQRYLRVSLEREFKDRFFTCWALKEAFIKAVGMGLSHPLNTFNVIDSHMRGPATGQVDLQGGGAKWFQLPFQPHPWYRAAIVMTQLQPLLQFFDFQYLLEGPKFFG